MFLFLTGFIQAQASHNPNIQLPNRANITPNGRIHLTTIAQILDAQTPGSYLRATHMPGLLYLFFRAGPETPENQGYHLITYINSDPQDPSKEVSVFSNSTDYLPADVSLVILTNNNHSLPNKKLISDIVHCFKQGEIHCPKINQLSVTLLNDNKS